jgi:hypothetical protein
MCLRLRLVLRFARVLVACVALGVVAGPRSAPVALLDTVAWIATTTQAETASERRSTDRTARPARPAAPRRASPPPAGAREVVVHSRIYILQAALLC